MEPAALIWAVSLGATTFEDRHQRQARGARRQRQELVGLPDGRRLREGAVGVAHEVDKSSGQRHASARGRPGRRRSPATRWSSAGGSYHEASSAVIGELLAVGELDGLRDLAADPPCEGVGEPGDDEAPRRGRRHRAGEWCRVVMVLATAANGASASVLTTTWPPPLAPRSEREQERGGDREVVPGVEDANRDLVRPAVAEKRREGREVHDTVPRASGPRRDRTPQQGVDAAGEVRGTPAARPARRRW